MTTSATPTLERFELARPIVPKVIRGIFFALSTLNHKTFVLWQPVEDAWQGHVFPTSSLLTSERDHAKWVAMMARARGCTHWSYAPQD